MKGVTVISLGSTLVYMIEILSMFNKQPHHKIKVVKQLARAAGGVVLSTGTSEGASQQCAAGARARTCSGCQS